MMIFNETKKMVALFKALASEPRIQIIKLLIKNECLSMREISEKLNVTQGAISSHIKVMTSCGLVRVTEETGVRGVRKMVSLKEKRLMVNLVGDEENASAYKINVPIGSYTACEIKPPCAIATISDIIEHVDSSEGFGSPERVNAGILWLGSGYVEYKLPLTFSLQDNIDEIIITMEIASEAPGTCEDWPSDITFFINNILVGTWTSPGDYGKIKGQYNPKWWDRNYNQHGLLKQLSINNSGTFMDEEKLSDITVGQICLPDENILILRLAVLEGSRNVGGMTIFGKGFGNHNQNIIIEFHKNHD